MKSKIFILFSFILILSQLKLIFSGWTDQIYPLSPNNVLQSVSTVDNNVGWICGSGGLVLRTTNGGVNWINVGNKNPIDSFSMGACYAINQNIAMVLSWHSSENSTVLYRTSNGGNNWDKVLSQQGGYFDAIMFKDSLNGFLVGDPVNGRWSLFNTSDQGLHWDSSGLYLPEMGSEYGFFRDIYIRGDSILFGTDNNRIYNSHDFGKNWTFSLVNCPLISTLTLNGNIGFAAEACVFKTTDSGINWLPINLYYEPPIGCLTHIDNEFWYSFDDSICYSSDNGNNFVIQHGLSSSSYDYYWQIDLKKINNQIVGWAVSNWGGISKYTAPIGIKPISSEIPNKFELFQNYPNPFNPSTTINYQIPSAGNVKLVIYDILGRELATLVNEKQQPGKYQVTWDASNFASGVYFYKLVTGNFTQIRKMVVLK